jgi:glucose-1-phosphate thymidylyltransferase
VQVQKALLLAGTPAGQTPWPSVPAGPRHLVPVANRPILFHALASLEEAGVRDLVIAVEPESADATAAAVRRAGTTDMVVDCRMWEPGTGLSGAVAVARDFVSDEPVLVQLADALVGERIRPHVAAFEREELDLLTLRLPGADPTPAVGRDGLHVLNHRAVSWLADDAGDAMEDVTAGLRALGARVRVQPVDGCLPCHGGEDSLLDGNRQLLERLKRSVNPLAYPTCELQGPVRIHPTATLEHCLVRGPATIGPGCWLSDAYVGPYTSIGAGVRIDGSQVEHSIVLDGAQLKHVGPRLESSVIGRGARIDRSFALPTAMRVSVGDGARITLP